MAITMSEIAKKLNISIATVSRALSGKTDSVSEDTKRAILSVAEKYGYQRRKTVGKHVAFIINKNLFNLSSQFYTGIISGVEEELIKSRYYFQFNSLEREKIDSNKINLNFPELAGAICVGLYQDDLVLKLQELSIPTVLVDCHLPTEDFPAVLIDNTDGVIKACKYLAELGHKQVAYITFDKQETSAQERLFGYVRAKDLFDFEDDPALAEECGGRIDEAHQAMNHILDRRTPPTAVLAHNDMMAIGVMDAIKQRGLSIPGDISVVGFDDIGLSQEIVPPLTTVHVPKHLMGIMAVRRLTQIIGGKEDPFKKILLPTRLVIRRSTAGPRP